MADRLTSITTGTGDSGTTGLAGGARLAKDAPRIEALGCIDELNASVGVAIVAGDNESVTVLQQRLFAMQHDLFDLGGEVAMPGTVLLNAAHVQRLERWQSEWQAELQPLANFILPGGSAGVAALQFARTLARKAERRLVTLHGIDANENPQSLVYLNRLSDLLFVAARWLSAQRNEPEHLWQQNIHRAGE